MSTLNILLYFLSDNHTKTNDWPPFLSNKNPQGERNVAVAHWKVIQCYYHCFVQFTHLFQWIRDRVLIFPNAHNSQHISNENLI